MSYIKIFTEKELDEDKFSNLLRFDYKREDTDSLYYPNPTYEYFYDQDEGKETWEEFVSNTQLIHGILDGLGIDYEYCIENAQYKDVECKSYLIGYNNVKK